LQTVIPSEARDPGFTDHCPLFIIISSKETRLPFDDLRQWIAALDRAGELKRIKTEADPILEIAEITDRVSKGTYNVGMAASAVPPSAARRAAPGGPALLFQNVKG
jgi:4-hydroxy-3-polyprenylbenzoate decarboxylase